MDSISYSGRVLVVDDEELNRDLLSRRLSKRGFAVECADGAVSADQCLQATDIDLILLDIMMPGVDGFEYLSQIRQRWDPSQMPVIMATAKDTSEDVVRALKLGANDYVTKPLDFQVVFARVETQLRLKKATEQLAEAHRLLQEDLNRAAHFQQSLLPHADLTVPGCRFAWSYLPCDALAGDFLNVIPLDQTRTAFYVLDVSGHGTPAALLTASVSRALSITNDNSSVVARTTRKGLMRGHRLEIVRPCDVSARLNRQFDRDTLEGKYFTMVYAIIDVEAGEMTYTMAGHPSQLFVPVDRDCELIECEGVPIGLLSDEEMREHGFQQKQLPVVRGDRIYLYSDGVLEAEDADNQQFGISRLRQVVDETRGLSLAESIDRVLAAIRAFSGAEAIGDDLSIMAIEISD